VSEFRDHWEVNTLGLVILFQAAHRLLLASPTNTPIFAFISSIAGSMGQHLPIQSSPYGSSKAAANFFIKSLHYENPMLIAMAIHPGFVMTEMGMDCATAIGIPKPPQDIDEAMAGVMSRIDGATREASGGRFWNFKVTRGNPWDVETEEVPW
jgi:norsolorinic acid ketoreductase